MVYEVLARKKPKHIIGALALPDSKPYEREFFDALPMTELHPIFY